MADRMTRIILPGIGSGYADYGRKTPEEMIAAYREYAEHLLAEAEAVLAARPGDFRVETYRGVYVMRDLKVLQEGRKP